MDVRGGEKGEQDEQFREGAEGEAGDGAQTAKLSGGGVMVTYTCLCCGIKGAFRDDEEAYQEGWDTPSRFAGVGPTCSLCPSAPLLTMGLEKARARHAPMHERWEKGGRPAEFETEQEFLLDGRDPAEAKRLTELIHALSGKERDGH